MSKPKEMYHTFKRSISSTANGLLKKSQPPPGRSARWVHPPIALQEGKVIYKVKVFGFIEVAYPKGSEVVGDAIHALSFKLSISPITKGSNPRKLQKAVIKICVDDVTVSDAETNLILYHHPLSKISYCADDKEDKRVFSYIAMETDGKYYCYVFLASSKAAEEITMTIGQAFDLLLKKYLDKKNPTSLSADHRMKALEEKVAELEDENATLRMENRYWKNKVFAVNPEALIPKTPVPSRPPAGYRNGGALAAPPLPPPSSRSKNGQSNDDIINLDLGGPQISSKLDALTLTKADAVFDDSFDPRSSGKDVFGLDTFAATPSSAVKEKNHGNELEEMIADCDSKINMMSSFTMGTIQNSADVDQLRCYDDDEIYLTPSVKGSYS